ncbi:MAG: DMT family transporter [Rubrobacter sp.]
MLPLLLLGLAILAEIVATTSLKASEGFTRLWPVALVVVGYAASFYLLALTLRSLPLGFAYAVWSGLGTAGAVLVGWILWRESLGLAGLGGVALIVAGVVVLNLSSGAH